MTHPIATPRSLRLAVVGVLAITGVATADPKEEAKVHIDKATAEHAAGKFAEALAELQAAYDLVQDPGLLYAIAQMQVKLERCADAIVNYEQFVASNPGEKPTQAANEAITACRASLAPKPEPKPAPKPEPPAPTPEPMRRDVIGPRAWYKDPLGGALTGAGVIGSVVGVVLYRSASADIDAAESAANYGSSEDLVSGAKSKRRNAMLAGGVGGALLIGGVIRYVMVGGRGTDQVALVPTGNGAAVTWSGRW